MLWSEKKKGMEYFLEYEAKSRSVGVWHSKITQNNRKVCGKYYTYIILKQFCHVAKKSYCSNAFNTYIILSLSVRWTLDTLFHSFRMSLVRLISGKIIVLSSRRLSADPLWLLCENDILWIYTFCYFIKLFKSIEKQIVTITITPIRRFEFCLITIVKSMCLILNYWELSELFIWENS